VRPATGLVLITAVAFFLGGSFPSHAGLNARAFVKIRWADSTGKAVESPVSGDPRPRMIVTATGLQNFRGADIQLLLYSCIGTPIPDAWLGNGTGGCNDGNWSLVRGPGPGGPYPDAFEGVPGLATLTNEELPVPQGMSFENKPLMMFRLRAYGTAGLPRDSTLEYALWSVQFDFRGKAAGGPVDCAGDVSNPGRNNVMWLFGALLNTPFQEPFLGFSAAPEEALLDGPGSIDRVASTVYYYFSPYSLAWTTVPYGIYAVCPTDAVREATWGQLRRIYR